MNGFVYTLFTLLGVSCLHHVYTNVYTSKMQVSQLGLESYIKRFTNLIF